LFSKGPSHLIARAARRVAKDMSRFSMRFGRWMLVAKSLEAEAGDAFFGKSLLMISMKRKVKVLRLFLRALLNMLVGRLRSRSSRVTRVSSQRRIIYACIAGERYPVRRCRGKISLSRRHRSVQSHPRQSRGDFTNELGGGIPGLRKTGQQVHTYARDVVARARARQRFRTEEVESFWMKRTKERRS